MRSGAFRAKRWISLGLLLVLALSFAVPTFALPYRWYKNVYVHKKPNKMTYKVGEYMDLAGLELWGDVYDSDGNFVFTNNDMSHLEAQYFKYSPSKFTKAGKQKVTFSCNCVAQSGNREWLSTSITVTVNEEKAELKITKHPKGETVVEGGACNFTARADNAEFQHWYFSKGSKVVDASDAAKRFPGLTISGVTKEKLKLSNIPISLNGWSVYCVFYDADYLPATSHKAKIVVHAAESTAEPSTPTPAPATPVPATPTPKPVIQAQPTEAPAAQPTPAATAKTLYAEGVHCTVNGQTRVPVEGQTLLQCEAESISGFIFDHWEINGEADYTFGPSAAFLATDACVIRACYHERKVLKTVNCYLQLLTASNNASGAKYTEFDFEEAYYNPVTKAYCAGGTLDCYVTAVIPNRGKVDYWLINGVKYQFPDNNIPKFRILDLNEATTIEPVFKGKTPVDMSGRPAIARELESQVRPMLLHCIECWGQFMNAAGNPAGQQYREFDFDGPYTNPVTKQALSGGLLDICISTKVPRGHTVDGWIINDVTYQFPQNVLRFRVMGLNEDTTYEVRFRGTSSPTRTPTVIN